MSGDVNRAGAAAHTVLVEVLAVVGGLVGVLIGLGRVSGTGAPPCAAEPLADCVANTIGVLLVAGLAPVGAGIVVGAALGLVLTARRRRGPRR